MYDQNDFYERLTKLRMEKGVSLREMSLALGNSEHYMKQIERGSTFPSMTAFFNICDYFGIHPRDFFSETEYPKLIHDINIHLHKMSETQLRNIEAITSDMIK